MLVIGGNYRGNIQDNAWHLWFDQHNTPVISRVENKLFTWLFLQEIWQIYIVSVCNETAQVVEIHPREMQEPDVNNMSIDVSVWNETAQVVEIHPQEMQEPDVNNMSIDGLVTQVSKAPEGMIWTWY